MLPHVVQGDDVGMVELGRMAVFAGKAFHRAPAGRHVRPRNLDGDQPLELLVQSQIDAPKASHAQLTEEAVPADCLEGNPCGLRHMLDAVGRAVLCADDRLRGDHVGIAIERRPTRRATLRPGTTHLEDGKTIEANLGLARPLPRGLARGFIRLPRRGRRRHLRGPTGDGGRRRPRSKTPARMREFRAPGNRIPTAARPGC